MGLFRLACQWLLQELLAFLEQAVEEVTDEVVDLFDRALTNSYARATRRTVAPWLGARRRPVGRD